MTDTTTRFRRLRCLGRKATLTRSRRLFIPDHFHLELELHAEAALHGVADLVHESQDVGGLAAAEILHEVGVHRADSHAASRPALEPSLLDQRRGVLAAWILEGGS